ncbi:hypothetical protein [Sphingomonas sp. BK580]|uniref:hypothetical protein n=1 Tax=Sphingomonas sp. BK580 TaxID=2586972 RepID=UPI00161A0F35|nr:hypothetical protein [Sphingomonas sp. BK580]MBB3693182.1 hypothetical protein [Sphingomonas sp. BK580]
MDQKASEWVPHNGGGLPIDPEERVRVRLRSGKVMRVARAKSRVWEHALIGIPAYQIVQFEIVPLKVQG